MCIKSDAPVAVPYLCKTPFNFFAEIKDTLAEGQHVKLSGFGNFVLRDKPERPGRTVHDY